MVRPTLSVIPQRGAEEEPCGAFEPEAGAGVQWNVLPHADSAWTVKAECTSVDPEALFVTGAAQRDATKVCKGCPVRLECLADALDNQIEYGVWGGMTERQRRAVLKKSPEVTSWRLLLEDARSCATNGAAG